MSICMYVIPVRKCTSTLNCCKFTHYFIMLILLLSRFNIYLIKFTLYLGQFTLSYPVFNQVYSVFRPVYPVLFCTYISKFLLYLRNVKCFRMFTLFSRMPRCPFHTIDCLVCCNPFITYINRRLVLTCMSISL